MKALSLAALLCLAWLAAVSSAAIADTRKVAIVTWRGCEEACQGFQDYLVERGQPVEFTIFDAAQDKARLPSILSEIRASETDLILTWGTTVTLGVAGTLDTQGATDLNDDIPQVFMIVADPVGSGIVRSLEDTGRPNVTGTYNRMPETVTLQTIRNFMPSVRHIGLLFNTDEKNSVIKRDELAVLAREQGLEFTALDIAIGADGKPKAEDIALKMERLEEAGVEFVYVGSSSFLQSHAAELGDAARATGLPVLSPYEDMVRQGGALVSVAARYADVGKLAGEQAEKILFENIPAGNLPVLRMKDFALTINMSVANALNIYPPIGLLQIAEIVD